MIERLLRWLQDLLDGPPATVPIEARFLELAESWDVPIEVARRTTHSYVAQHGIGIAPAMDELCDMKHSQAVREIGEQ